MKRFIPLCLALVVNFGCQSMPVEVTLDKATRQANQALNTPIAMHSTQNNAQHIDQLLDAPLDVHDAVELLLLVNQDTQATWHRLRVAHGDYLNKSSLPNPVLDFLSGRAEGTGDNLREYAVSFPLLQLAFLPRARRSAQNELDANTLRHTYALLEQVTALKKIYYRTVASQQRLQSLNLIAKTEQAKATLAQSLFEAGNVSAVKRDAAQLMLAQTQLELAEAKAECALTEAYLSQALGLSLAQSQRIQLPNALPTERAVNLPTPEYDVLANNHLLLRAANLDMQAMALAMGHDSIESVIGELEFAASQERNGDEPREDRAGLSFEIPLFSTGSGARLSQREQMAAAHAEWQASHRRLQLNASNLHNQLRAVQTQLEMFETTVMPLGNKVLRGTQLEYNAMQHGADELLSVRQEQLELMTTYTSTLADYWSLHASIEQLANGGGALEIMP